MYAHTNDRSNDSPNPRRQWGGWWLLSAGVILAVVQGVLASDDGQAAAALVSEASYRHFMDDMMYTHIGDDRGFGAEHDLARANIADIFESFGLVVTLEPFEYAGETYYNVVGTKLGLVFPDQELIVGAHFDSVDNPGADDDASGVSMVLESARVVSPNPSEYTIRFIAFDREEQGLNGSEAYVASHIDDNILGMVNADMMAYNVGTSHVDVYGRESSNSLKSAVANAIAMYGSGVSSAVGGQRDYSDHASFEAEGFQACHVREDLGNPYYHTQSDSVDTPNYIDYAYATEITRGVVGFLVDAAVVSLAVCGDGIVAGNEQCDTAIPPGEPGACPTSCESGDPCISSTLLEDGSCFARCDIVIITDPADGDGCCPPGAHANSDDDCTPICGNGVCEAGEDQSCLQDCECTDDSECGDAWACTVGRCLGGMCSYLPTDYGDVDNSGAINIFDMFCVLNAFAGHFDECTFDDVDIAPCTGNGSVGVFDLFAVLNAFGGSDPCCGGPAPPARSRTMAVTPAPAIEVPSAVISLLPSSLSIPAGGEVSVDVLVSSAADIRAYELTLEAVGNGSGRLESKSVAIDTANPNYAFAGLEAFHTVNGDLPRMAGVLRGGSVIPKGDAYLGSCTFRASPDAAGTFTIRLKPRETELLDGASHPIKVRLASQVEISVR